MTQNEALTIVILTYISVLVYTVMISLELYNSYKYLYLKKKYTVFPVCLFDALSIPATALRIYENIWAVYLVTYNVVIIYDMPLVMKIPIALS